MDSTIIAAIIEGVITLIVGLLCGYNIGIKSTKKQLQKSKNNSNQIQVGEINYAVNTKSER